MQFYKILRKHHYETKKKVRRRLRRPSMDRALIYLVLIKAQPFIWAAHPLDRTVSALARRQLYQINRILALLAKRHQIIEDQIFR